MRRIVLNFKGLALRSMAYIVSVGRDTILPEAALSTPFTLALTREI